MFKKMAGVISVVSMVTLLFSVPAMAAPAQGNGPSPMPPSEEKIQAALQARGQIPAGSTQAQADSIVKAYLEKKINPGQKTPYASPKDEKNPLMDGKIKEAEDKFRGQAKSGGPRIRMVPNSIPLPLHPTRRTGKILALLVEFGADPGPLAGNLPEPADPNKDYWVPNFDKQHYAQMLFDRSPGANSLANFYLAQSDGVFTVDGSVFGWIRLPYPESHYGADSGEGGHDNANGPAWRIVQDAIRAAIDQGIQVPYRDFDGDGDGYVDSLMVIHAGAGQEGGGGAQGDDSIWSHSWFVDYANGGVRTWDGTMVGPYTIEPEDGAVGVFAHEYGHQLGLPDLYDTTYIGESSTGFYTLMSSGSWLGKPLGTQPANLDIWSKMVLGWTPDMVEVNQGPGGQKDFLVRSTESFGTFNKGFRINLPPHPVTTSINTPIEGQYEWWSTMGDDLSTTMTRTVDLTGAASATLRFKTWYNIEYDYDYGFVEVSTDNGASFSKIAGNITRDIGGGVQGIDGSSNGWVDAVYDLSAYAGKTVQLRFHYLTDGGVALKGWAIDSISIPEIGFGDNAEVSPNGWSLNGFRQFAGSETVSKTHYYIGELVRPFGTNLGLNWAYNFYAANFERFACEPGVLLWYRDTAFVDNNVGLHPGQGRLLLVDSHSAPMMQANGRPFRTRIQIYDAPFGPKATSPLAVHGKDGALVSFPSLPGVKEFDDSRSYYNSMAPYNSVKTPTYGVDMEVLGVSQDGSAAFVHIDY